MRVAGHYLMPLARFWAEHGFACLMPMHSDSLRLRGIRTPLDQTQRRQVVIASYSDPQNWQERSKDISFLLDALGHVENQIGGLDCRLDPKRVGVAGHSLGGQTAQLLAGALMDLPDGQEQCRFADPRVHAIVCLSSAGKGLYGLTTDSWQSIHVPMLTASGSLDVGPGGLPPEWRMDAFRHSPSGDKYHLSIDGAYHGSFVGHLPKGTPSQEEIDRQVAIFGYVKTATLSFWNAYLRDDADAARFLRSDALQEASRGTAILQSR
jgi:predicted dienelactone hydrolase